MQGAPVWAKQKYTVRFLIPHELKPQWQSLIILCIIEINRTIYKGENDCTLKQFIITNTYLVNDFVSGTV